MVAAPVVLGMVAVMVTVGRAVMRTRPDGVLGGVSAHMY